MKENELIQFSHAANLHAKKSVAYDCKVFLCHMSAILLETGL